VGRRKGGGGDTAEGTAAGSSGARIDAGSSSSASMSSAGGAEKGQRRGGNEEPAKRQEGTRRDTSSTVKGRSITHKETTEGMGPINLRSGCDEKRGALSCSLGFNKRRSPSFKMRGAWKASSSYAAPKALK